MRRRDLYNDNVLLYYFSACLSTRVWRYLSIHMLYVTSNITVIQDIFLYD